MNQSLILKKFYRWTTLLTVSALLSVSAFSAIAASAENSTSSYVSGNTDTYDSGYSDYLSKYSETAFAKESYTVTAQNAVGAGETIVADGVTAHILNEENTLVEYSFSVEESALYNIKLTYYPLIDSNQNIQLGFKFDGEYPYTELENVSFSRIWVNKYDEIMKDKSGNQLRPELVEKQRLNTEWLQNETGLYNEPYAVYLTAGTHTLSIVHSAESAAISQITLTAYEKAITYDEYNKKYSDKKILTKENLLIEAEDTYEVSSNTLAATIDSTNAGMSPASPSLRLVNSFGKDYWDTNGQWASWKVPQDVTAGRYILRLRVQQNYSVGVTSYRTLLINGEVPFDEAQNISFEYNKNWYIKTIGDDSPYYIYLEPGDIITLKATTGEMAGPLNEIYTSVNDLNAIYQSIVMITGIEPDEERDYSIEKEIPTLIADLTEIRNKIGKIADDITVLMGENNSKTYFFRQFEQLLDSFIGNHRLIVPELSNFKSYIDSYVAQTYDFNALMLEMDYIQISGSKTEEPKAEASFWEMLIFEIKRFLATFVGDYDVTESEANGPVVEVWTSLGRDQTQAVKSLIESDFTAKTDINVELKMTTTELSQAILAGLEPDVSLQVLQEDPINLALRGQVVDLSSYIAELDDEYMSQFSEWAFTPFTYKGGIYAMPVTQDFNVMFCRTDILEKLGLKVPDTWDELYESMRELQINNYQVGLKESDDASAGVSSAINVFDMFLLQNGGEYFNSELTETAFESKEGKQAFTDWVKLYRDYDLDTNFDLLTRFRSGEMPILITSFSFYQKLSATALEIRGRWEMCPVPGTLKADGTIDRSVSSTMTGAIILKGAQKRKVADEAFEFLKWWVDCDTQVDYSLAMEAIQGIAGRVYTANRKAFEQIGWTTEEKAILSAQWEWAKAIPQVPGTYIINRSLTNALRNSYESPSVDPLRQLNIQNRIINEEMTRKRAEFENNN